MSVDNRGSWRAIPLEAAEAAYVHMRIESVPLLGRAARILAEDLRDDASLSVFALPTSVTENVPRTMVQSTYDVAGVLNDYGGTVALYRPSLFYEVRRNEAPEQFGIPSPIPGFKSRVVPGTLFGYMRVVNLGHQATYSLGVIDNSAKINYMVNLSPTELDC